MTGVKHDSQKPRVDLVPYEAIEAMAKVLTKGLEKYPEANWANGIEFSRLFSATMRHLGQFQKGIDLDPESNLPHIHHALTNLAMLVWMMEHRPDLDNRWVKNIKTGDVDNASGS